MDSTPRTPRIVVDGASLAERLRLPLDALGLHEPLVVVTDGSLPAGSVVAIGSPERVAQWAGSRAEAAPSPLLIALDASAPDARWIGWPSAAGGDALARVIQLGIREADAGARLREHERMLRKAMVEKGELILRQLEEAHTRAAGAAETARRDPATELLRHGHFRERLGFELERGRRANESVGLILADLDGFRRFNEERGYVEGEQVLRIVGRSLDSLWLSHPAARPPALGREGGDCFGAILPAADREETLARAEQIRNLVERLPIGPPRLTASVGAAVAGEAPAEAEGLLAAARRRMEAARARGGNRVVADDSVSTTDG